MKHYIIVKFNDKNVLNTSINDIKAIFEGCLSIKGIRNVCVKSNVISRENRYDLMIEITMDKESLKEYDESIYHKMWKDKYGPFIEKKTIIDTED